MADKSRELYQSGGFHIKQKDPVARLMKTPQGIWPNGVFLQYGLVSDTGT
jgi:hypothetical protein